MGRSSKDKNVEEHLRGLLRQLKSENRNLKKQIARLEKQSKNYQSFSTWPEEEIELDDISLKKEIKEEALKCSQCGAVASKIDLGSRKLIHCKKCNHRVTIK